MLFIFSSLDTLRPWAVDENVVSVSHSFQSLPAHIPWPVHGGTWNGCCWLHWDELALCGGRKKPCKDHKKLFFCQHSQWGVAAVPTAWWESLKRHKEKLLCLNSSRRFRNQNWTPGNPRCGSWLHLPPQGQSNVASKYSWSRFPQGAFQRRLWLPGSNRTEAVIIPNVRIIK